MTFWEREKKKEFNQFYIIKTPLRVYFFFLIQNIILKTVKSMVTFFYLSVLDKYHQCYIIITSLIQNIILKTVKLMVTLCIYQYRLSIGSLTNNIFLINYQNEKRKLIINSIQHILH